MTLGKGNDFNLSRKFSLEAWFRPNPSKEGSYTMILGNKYGRQFQLDWTSNSGGTIEFYVGGGDLVKKRAVKSYLKDGNWMHIAAVYDSTIAEGPNQFLYVNGELANAIRNESPCPPIYGGPLRIAQNRFTGIIPVLFWHDIPVRPLSPGNCPASGNLEYSR